MPWNLVKLHAETGNRDKAITWLLANGLLNAKKLCVIHNMLYGVYDDKKGYPFFRCGRKPHRNLKISIANGTLFEDIRCPPDAAIKLLYCFAHNYSYQDTTREVSFATTVSKATISRWFGNLRELINIDLLMKQEEDGQIGGEGFIVEVRSAAGARPLP